MTLYIKYNMGTLCQKVLQEQLDKLDFSYSLDVFGEIQIKQEVPIDYLKQLNNNLNCYGIELVESPKSILVQKIKDAIIEMVCIDEDLPTEKISNYLATKLNHSYGYLSHFFSEATFTTIEKFIILQKIERAKEMIALNEFTFTEVAWKPNYSSVAHFSHQFKHATGLTPSAFQRIINKRRNNGGNSLSTHSENM